MIPLIPLAPVCNQGLKHVALLTVSKEPEPSVTQNLKKDIVNVLPFKVLLIGRCISKNANAKT